MATEANGCAAFGSYKHQPPAAGTTAWGIQVIEASGDRITGHHNFVDADLFAAFGLPAEETCRRSPALGLGGLLKPGPQGSLMA